MWISHGKRMFRWKFRCCWGKPKLFSWLRRSVSQLIRKRWYLLFSPSPELSGNRAAAQGRHNKRNSIIWHQFERSTIVTTLLHINTPSYLSSDSLVVNRNDNSFSSLRLRAILRCNSIMLEVFSTLLLTRVHANAFLLNQRRSGSGRHSGRVIVINQ